MFNVSCYTVYTIATLVKTIVKASIFFTCNFRSSSLVVIAAKSSAYASALDVWSAYLLPFRQPYLYPQPPVCSHRRSGSMNMKGDSVPPCMLPMSMLIASVSAYGSLTLVLAFVYKSLIACTASTVKPRSCMMHSSLSWSILLNAELKSTYSMYRSLILIFASHKTFKGF